MAGFIADRGAVAGFFSFCIELCTDRLYGDHVFDVDLPLAYRIVQQFECFGAWPEGWPWQWPARTVAEFWLVKKAQREAQELKEAETNPDYQPSGELD